MKLSVSLTEQDLELLDRYISAHSISSRSAAIQHAIRALPDASLEDAYADAWDEWSSSPDAELWEQVSADGLDRAAR